MPIVPIIPKRFDLSTGFIQLINNANKRFSENEARSFRRTVQTWTNRPTFKVRVSATNGGVNDYEVLTEDKVFFWVNFGTDPHEIAPKPPKGYLAFQQDFSPKTSPDNIEAKQGGKSGTWFTTNQPVEHPGIKARRFDLMMKKNAPERWSKALNRELLIWTKLKVR